MFTWGAAAFLVSPVLITMYGVDYSTFKALCVSLIAVPLVMKYVQTMVDLIAKSRSWERGEKIAAQSQQLFFHVTMTMWGAQLLIENPDMLSNFSCPSVNYGRVSFYYMVQLCVWFFTGMSCLFIEKRGKDFYEMMLHHVVTVTLVATSFLHGLTYAGVVIMVLHDSSDIAVDILKIFNYMKLDGKRWWYATEIMFVLQTYVTWPITRLYIFPVRVAWVIVTSQCPPWYIKAMLTILCVLHLIWWIMMNRIALSIMIHGTRKAGADH